MAGGSLRDAIKVTSPKWLQGSVGEKFLYVFGLMCDALSEKTNQAMRMHIPTYGDVSGLANIGTDRLIPQGSGENPSNYAQRLKLAYDSWQLAGSARSIMQQMLGVLSPSTFLIRTVATGTNGSSWDTYVSGANPQLPPGHALISAANWVWDNPAQNWWSRAWVIIDCSAGLFANEGTWGDGKLWGDGGTWGSTATVSQVTALQAVARLWKPANVQIVSIILNFDATNFNQSLAFGSGHMPDGNWGLWEKYSTNTSVPSRFSNAAYLDGA